MPKINSIIRLSCWIAAVITVATAGARADDSQCYLPTVGPTSLRFQKVQVFKPLKVPPLSMENASLTDETGAPEKMSNPLSPSGLNDIPARYFLPTTLWLNRLSGQGEIESTPGADIYYSASNPSTNSQPTIAPASDLLNISPQMLAEYFKPGQPLRSKGANTSVYVPVDFKPATPTVTPPSSATYNSPP